MFCIAFLLNIVLLSRTVCSYHVILQYNVFYCTMYWSHDVIHQLSIHSFLCARFCHSHVVMKPVTHVSNNHLNNQSIIDTMNEKNIIKSIIRTWQIINVAQNACFAKSVFWFTALVATKTVQYMKIRTKLFLTTNPR